MQNSDNYRNLGNLSATPDWASVGLDCNICKVRWIGCWDNAACPECGNHEAWDKLMESRRYYETKI